MRALELALREVLDNIKAATYVIIYNYEFKFKLTDN
jgi:hypothetical protein